MYKLCQVHAGSETGNLHGTPGDTAKREELSTAQRKQGGKGSQRLADEHDEAWEMAGLLGQAQLEKEPLSSSILPWTLGKVP